jgi:hypothetical protein
MATKIPTFPIPRPSNVYPNWDFWSENIPSGNPARYYGLGGEGVSGTSYASPPPCPSIFSNYSLIVHHPVNRDDRHLLAHAMASNFTVAWQYSVLLLVWAAGGTALPQILRYGLAFRWTPDYFQREQSIFCYGLNSTP